MRILKAKTKYSCGDCGRKKKNSEAFTLLELLVAMGILVIIVLIVARIFAQASATWSTGVRLSEVNMTGRAVVDFVAQDLSQAVMSTNMGYDFDPANGFWIIDSATNATRARMKVSYSYNPGSHILLRRQLDPVQPDQQLCDTNLDAFVIVVGPGYDFNTQTLPQYVDVNVSISGANTGLKYFSSRVTFPNRSRYKY